jgi:hypothetical protein
MGDKELSGFPNLILHPIISVPSSAWGGTNMKLRFKEYAHRKQSFRLFLPKQELGKEMKNIPAGG